MVNGQKHADTVKFTSTSLDKYITDVELIIVVMSEISMFKKSFTRGVSQHFKCEQDRVQNNIDLYSQYVDTYATCEEPHTVSLEFAQDTLENCKNELTVIGFYYKNPDAYTVQCLCEIHALMQQSAVTYDMVSAMASCIFFMNQMSCCVSWIRAVERPRFCRWLWDNWSETPTPIDLESTWVAVHTISCDFMSVWGNTELPTHPVPIPMNRIAKSSLTVAQF